MHMLGCIRSKHAEIYSKRAGNPSVTDTQTDTPMEPGDYKGEKSLTKPGKVRISGIRILSNEIGANAWGGGFRFPLF